MLTRDLLAGDLLPREVAKYGFVLLQIVDEFPLLVFGAVVNPLDTLALIRRGHTSNARAANLIALRAPDPGRRLTRREQRLLNGIDRRVLLPSEPLRGRRLLLAREAALSGLSCVRWILDGLARLPRLTRLNRLSRLLYALIRLTWSHILPGLNRRIWIRLTRLSRLNLLIGLPWNRLGRITRLSWQQLRLAWNS